MWRFVIFVAMLGSRAEAQVGRAPNSEHTNSHGWDIRLAVPGEPGNDYPTLSSIPRTTFSCAGKEPGYYADLETGCQVFRVCTVGSTYGFQSFLCPNGTLFNQDVFVCDWWMHVKCQTYQLLKTQNEKFGNLRLGPQLMKDVKKMLTYPMRNSYDKTAMKSNLIVMQDYKPPAGQLFPNGALIAGPERPPNNIYVPAKQIQQNLVQGFPNDVAFAASTPETRYIPAGFTRPTNNDAEVFQRQRQLINDQYRQVQTTQLSETGNIVSNGHASQYTQKSNNGQKAIIQQTLPNQNLNQVNSQYIQKNYNDQYNNIQQPRQNQNYNYANTQFTRNDNQITRIQQPRQHQNFNTGQHTQSQRSNIASSQTAFRQNTPKGQINRARAQYTDGTKSVQSKSGRQNQIDSYTKQQYNQEKRPYTYRPPIPPLPEELNAPNFKQNLVSDVPPTVITKTLTFSKILQEPKPGRPKSRVTVKTWIVKPKSARLIAEPSSYVYPKPTQSPTQRLIADETALYVYNRPTTTTPQPARIVNEESPIPYNYPTPTTSRPKSQRVVEDFSFDPEPYVYNRPSPPLTTPKTENIEENEPTPYFYNRPTVTSRQILKPKSEPSQQYLPPTSSSPPPTESAQLNIPTFPSTTPSKHNPPPTTFKPAARLYLPPDDSQPARQYLAPAAIQQPSNYQSAQLRAKPTSTTTSALPTTNENPSYTVVKQSRINASRNNLTFTDILTKEKLDITVNDIVRDTGNILQTASPPQFSQYREDVQSIDYPNENYLPAEIDESDEQLTSQVPTATTPSKSARLIAQPARNLEPPVERVMDVSSNKLANLPFLKESLLPNTASTIERTVSLKITIPERLASYLLKGNDTDFNQLEILNTGSSNYIVLSNQNTGDSIPIKNSNVSNSQALVFSFLADSLNQAKEYSNIVKQDALPSTSTPRPAQLRNLNNEDLSQISNRVSQLTSAQFSGNNDFKSANLPSSQSTTTTSPRDNSLEDQSQQTQEPPSTQTQTQLAQYRINDNIINSNSLDTNQNQNQIYSGQLYKLPVPEVTSQIYNRPRSSNLVQKQTQTASPQARNNVANHNNLAKQSSEVETVQSQQFQTQQTLPKLQLSSNEPSYSQENLNNLLNDNGISAQVQDKIVGTIPHPLENNKLLTYEKDQSYYLFTKFDNGQNAPLNAVVKTNNVPSVITFQLVPSVSYQLEDEKEQQKLLNQFQIDEFGAPRGVVRANLVQQTNQQPALTSSVDYSIEHPKSPKQIRLEPITALYQGPSSYLAPQGSIGSLPRQTLLPSSRLEQLNENTEGYTKTIPVRRFIF